MNRNFELIQKAAEQLKELVTAVRMHMNFEQGVQFNENFAAFEREIEPFISHAGVYQQADLMGRASLVSSQVQKISNFIRLSGLSVSVDMLDELTRQSARLVAMVSMVFENELDNIRQLEEIEKDLRKQIHIEQGRLTEIEIKINTLQDTASTEIQKISLAYEETRAVLDEKKAQIDELVGHASAQVVAGDYAKSSEVEKRMADMLRWGSIACMAFVVAILGVTAFKSLDAEIHWENFVIRITLALLLSVPAAYLARESAKHREQQYQHLQTSLDLKAITPFLASLPPEEQHKIKIDIASKIFAGRDFSRVGADPFPINAHELVMEIIKKLELPKSASRGPGQ